ncbi:endoplasmic reticulum-Golgi intermediate compartment protein 2 [Crotalus tigris]|uniref:endoplasmic reticulum-Golgi intermediate compartment protein 2 n=1 Tax=Crotalus tigris TaxID=88082 RepID=UPI00192FB0BE|nr:endoplasmic reticulum-Golgi intermediate compartment protein 2 [Crotalus tigris]XP_039210430.1 endoplasmic reticulum-Golgi intermediate compartment protein 2 [Crotalus tigris]
MRRLNRKKTLNLVKELDAFPKIPDSYIETSTSGGTVSLIAFTTMALLTIMEFTVYRDTWMKYEYEVDKDYTSKLRINVDITVAMKCQHIGADVLDLAETMVATADGLVYEPVIFELSPLQREWQRILQNIQSRLQEEHSLQDIIFKSAFKSASTALPPREDKPVQSADACRIHGHLYVNKVAGNFHVTVGKAIPHPRGHAHLAALVSHESYNFSHRIDHLSFGELIPGIINPLDGTEKIASDHNQMFQYFVTVVPTKLQTHKISAETHQFAVTERERIINHAAGSHGVSGIFMKYDISSLMVTVTEEHMPFWQFLVRLCGIVGGIFSTTGILHSIGRFIVEILCCRFRLKSSKSTPATNISNTPSSSYLPHNNNPVRFNFQIVNEMATNLL